MLQWTFCQNRYLEKAACFKCLIKLKKEFQAQFFLKIKNKKIFQTFFYYFNNITSVIVYEGKKFLLNKMAPLSVNARWPTVTSRSDVWFSSVLLNFFVQHVEYICRYLVFNITIWLFKKVFSYRCSNLWFMCCFLDCCCWCCCLYFIRDKSLILPSNLF